MTASFGSPTILPTGDGPQQVVLADFNGDAKLDLAVATTASHWIDIRLGHGDGTFGNAAHVVAGAAPVELLAADLDGDGALDLAVANATGDNISVLLGNGDGTFRPATQYAAGHTPRAMAVADLDGDGTLDLVAGNQGNNVSLYRGHGDGTFDPQEVLALQDQANGVAIADIDHDGHPDLLVSGYFNLHVFHNDGTGRFPTRTSFNSGGGGGVYVATLDVNGDGHIDAVQSNSANNFVSLFLGDGRGGFDGPYQTNVGGNPFGIVAGDLDGDGTLDLAVASGSLSILPGNGDGTFGQRLDVPVGRDATFLAVGDLDSDGKPDIVTSSYLQDQLAVLRNSTGTVPVVGLSLGDVLVPEGDAGATNVPVIVRLSAPTAQTVTVPFASVGGTAIPGVDYMPVSGVLTFNPGETSRTFVVAVVGNRKVDGTRTIGLTLGAPSSGATVDDGAAVLTIQDDERPSVFRFQTTQVVADPSAGLVTVTVVRDDDRSDGVTVRYATVGGDAVAGVDYVPVQGTLRFAAGQDTLSFTVPILGNVGSRTDRVIGLALSQPVGGTVGSPSTATIRISAPNPPIEPPTEPTQPNPPIEPTPPVLPTPPGSPFVTVQSVAVRSRRGGALGSITLTFTGNLDPRSARSTENYRLVSAGRDGRFGTRDDRRFAIRSAIYRAGTRTITLTPRAAHIRATPQHLTITASVTDARGFALDGDRNGLPGGDHQATIRRGWYTVVEGDGDGTPRRSSAASRRFRMPPVVGQRVRHADRGPR